MGCADPPRRPKRGVGAPHQCPRVDRKTKWSSVDGQSLPAPTELPPRCRPTLPPTRGRIRPVGLYLGVLHPSPATGGLRTPRRSVFLSRVSGASNCKLLVPLFRMLTNCAAAIILFRPLLMRDLL